MTSDGMHTYLQLQTFFQNFNLVISYFTYLHVHISLVKRFWNQLHLVQSSVLLH